MCGFSIAQVTGNCEQNENEETFGTVKPETIRLTATPWGLNIQFDVLLMWNFKGPFTQRQLFFVCLSVNIGIIKLNANVDTNCEQTLRFHHGNKPLDFSMILTIALLTGVNLTQVFRVCERC